MVFGFWKKKEAPVVPPPPSLSDASGKIDQSIDSLSKRISECDSEISKWKSSGGGIQGRSRALATLKRKKMLEEQRDRLYGTQGAIDQAVFATESADATRAAVEAMKAGVANFNKVGFFPTVEECEDVAEEMEEFMETQREVTDVLAGGTGFVNDDDLLAELDGIEAEIQREKNEQVAIAPLEKTPVVSDYSPAPAIALKR